MMVGNGDWMGDVRLAGEPELTFVSLGRQGMRPSHQVEILAATPGPQGRENPFHFRSWGRDEGPGGVLRGHLTKFASRPGQHWDRPRT